MTKIRARNGSNDEPYRGVTKKEAKRHLQANAKGKAVEPKALKQSKKAAADHYASETSKAHQRGWK